MNTLYLPQAAPDIVVDINTTPLIDVLLVLLVMLIITIPVQLHAVKTTLPTPTRSASATPVPPVRVDIDAAGRVLWQGEEVSDAELETRCQAGARQEPALQIQIRPDAHASYARFIRVMAISRRAKLDQVAIIGAEQFVR